MKFIIIFSYLISQSVFAQTDNAIEKTFYALCSDEQCIEQNQFQSMLKTTVCDAFDCVVFNHFHFKKHSNGQMCDNEKCFTFSGQTSQGLGEFGSKQAIDKRYGSAFNIFLDGAELMVGLLADDAISSDFASIKTADSYVLEEGTTEAGFWNKVKEYGNSIYAYVAGKIKDEIDETDTATCYIQRTDGSRRGFKYSKSGGWQIIYIAPVVEDVKPPTEIQ